MTAMPPPGAKCNDGCTEHAHYLEPVDPKSGLNLAVYRIIAEIEAKIELERYAVGESCNGWHQGAACGLARALDIVREVAAS